MTSVRFVWLTCILNAARSDGVCHGCRARLATSLPTRAEAQGLEVSAAPVSLVIENR
jgi:hypothetical protein